MISDCFSLVHRCITSNGLDGLTNEVRGKLEKRLGISPRRLVMVNRHLKSLELPIRRKKANKLN